MDEVRRVDAHRLFRHALKTIDWGRIISGYVRRRCRYRHTLRADLSSRWQINVNGRRVWMDWSPAEPEIVRISCNDRRTHTHLLVSAGYLVVCKLEEFCER